MITQQEEIPIQIVRDNARVLVLNITFEPIGAVHWKRGLMLILDGDAEMLEDSETVVRSTGGLEFNVPSVIRLNHIVPSVYQRRQPYTRSAVKSRDNYTCQIVGCNRRGDTIDHVIPQSKGGKTTFENCIACCKYHNSEKDDKSLREMGWKLKKRPRVPEFELLLSSKSDPLWDNWLAV